MLSLYSSPYKLGTDYYEGRYTKVYIYNAQRYFWQWAVWTVKEQQCDCVGICAGKRKGTETSVLLDSYKSAVSSFIKSHPVLQSRNNSCLTQVEIEGD